MKNRMRSDSDLDSVFFFNEKCLKLDLKRGFHDAPCLSSVLAG